VAKTSKTKTKKEKFKFCGSCEVFYIFGVLHHEIECPKNEEKNPFEVLDQKFCDEQPGGE